MIFQHSLRRDLASLAGIVFSTLFTIMVTTTLIRMLGRASAGKVDTGSVLPLIAFASINFLPVILVLTLFISILMALTRAYQDSEMVIWFASGQSLTAFIRPVLGFAIPFVLAIAAVSFFLAPWANQQSSDYQQRFESREDVSQLSAGQFRESAASNRVFFVESLSENDRVVKNVFVTQGKGEEFSVVVSSTGFIETNPDGQRFLVLEKGRRYDGVTTAPAFRLTEFERYGVRLDPAPAAVRDESARLQTTYTLVANPTPRYLGELVWRISLPVSAVLLALLAIPMSFVNPRVGRSFNLVVSLLIYVAYNNMLSVTQAWVSQGRTSFWIAVWEFHAVLAVVIIVMFWRRTRLPRFRLSMLWSRA